MAFIQEASSMKTKADDWIRGSVLAAAWLLALAAGSAAQGLFYREVPKDGRIYVFASPERYTAWEQGGGAEMGAAITRLGYGPAGETVVFDSEDAINLYNFKHDKPGEVFPKPKAPAAASPYPAGKFSGLMFGDYYWYDRFHQDQVSASNPSSVQGQQGFWLRRIYFTYDLAFSERFTTRLRLEMNSNGQFSNPGNLNSYVKDAFLRWTYKGRQQATLGIQPTLTIDWVESFWGLRHIEKTPADLYRIDSSRDFGLTLSGPLELKGLSYAAQVANDSSTGSETDKFKTVRLEGRFDRNPGLALDAVYDHGQRTGGQDRSTFSGFLGYRNNDFRVSGLYLWQERQSGTAAPDQTIDIWSAFGIWEFGLKKGGPKKGDLFVRWDKVGGQRGGVDTGLPGADGIDYWILSPAQPFHAYIFGGEWYLLRPSIRISPNVEMAKYEADPDPVHFPGRDTDRIYRITFFWTF
jgi:hypothetical protein